LAGKPWTEAEIEYLKASWGKQTLTEIAKYLGRSAASAKNKAVLLGLTRKKPPRWTEEETVFLRNNWGKLSLRQLAKRLNRTEHGILVRAKRLKLGPLQDKSKFCKREVCELLGVDHRKVERWIEAGLLKASIAKTKRTGVKCLKITEIAPSELERFLKENPDLWDSRKAGDIMAAIREKEHLDEKLKIQRKEGRQKRRIPEHLKPTFAVFVANVAMDAADRIREAKRKNEWLKQKRRRDQERCLPREGFKWTKEEDDELRRLFKQGLTYREIGERLGRSDKAVGHRLGRIQVWQRRGA